MPACLNTIQSPEGSIHVVDPGGIDQDIRARDIAMDFFDSLAASLTYTLTSSPTTLYTQQRTAVLPSPFFHESREHRLTIGYFTDTAKALDFDWKEPKDILWNSSNPLPKIYQDKLWWTTDLAGAYKSFDKKSMGITDKPRFILLTGFLGAGEQALDRFEVARDQVRLADTILVNKCDLSDVRHLDRLQDRIRQLNPTADIHQTSHGDINPAILYGTNFRNPPKRPLFRAMGNGLTATHENDRIETRFVELDAPLNKELLFNAINSGGRNILRVKGIAEFTDLKGPMVFQYAPGTCNISPLTTRDTNDRFLVVIGQDLDKNFKHTCLTTKKDRSKEG